MNSCNELMITVYEEPHAMLFFLPISDIDIILSAKLEDPATLTTSANLRT